MFLFIILHIILIKGDFNFIYSLRPINWYMRYKNNIIIYICTNWSEVHIYKQKWVFDNAYINSDNRVDKGLRIRSTDSILNTPRYIRRTAVTRPRYCHTAVINTNQSIIDTTIQFVWKSDCHFEGLHVQIKRDVDSRPSRSGNQLANWLGEHFNSSSCDKIKKTFNQHDVHVFHFWLHESASQHTTRQVILLVCT